MKFTEQDLKDLIKEVLSEPPVEEAVSQRDVRKMAQRQQAGSTDAGRLISKMLGAPGIAELLPAVQELDDRKKARFLVSIARQVLKMGDLAPLLPLIKGAERRAATMREDDDKKKIHEITPKTKFDPKGILGMEKLARKNNELIRSLTDQVEFDDNTPAGRVLAAIEMNNQAILNAAYLASASSEMATYLAGNPKHAAQIRKRMTARQGE